MPVCILIYLLAYKLSGKDLRICNGVLVLEGLVFYWWAEPKLLLFFVSLSLLLYFLGIAISNTSSDDEKNMLMIFGVVIFAFLPVIYRYLPSIKIAVEDTPVTMPLFTAMLVPCGIAFYVLGASSYILDIYTGEAIAGSLMDAFAYTLFFPKAVCGPAVLWRDFSSQLRNRKTDLEKVNDGIRRIIIGYAKKAVLADTFAAQITLINTKMSTNSTDSLTVWLLGVLYFFRIYCDFSGYSDIAIGLCSIFGFDIGENFQWPYLSGSVTDFWRRWHISLGRWFREYIYIPLGGNRTGIIYLNIFITFIISALWHGWKWNLLLWGILNGLAVILEKAFNRKEKKTTGPHFVSTIVTVLLVYFGWILFMAADLTAAGDIFRSLFISPGGEIPNFTWRFFLTRRTAVFLVIAAAGSFGVLRKMGDALKGLIPAAVYDVIDRVFLLVLFAVDIVFVFGTAYTPFIYTLIP